MTNLQVVGAWDRGEPASSSNLHTDGRNLYSYQLLIGRTLGQSCEVKLIINFRKGTSHTTRAHINLTMRESTAALIHPTKDDLERLAKCLPQ